MNLNQIHQQFQIHSLFSLLFLQISITHKHRVGNTIIITKSFTIIGYSYSFTNYISRCTMYRKFHQLQYTLQCLKYKFRLSQYNLLPEQSAFAAQAVSSILFSHLASVTSLYSQAPTFVQSASLVSVDGYCCFLDISIHP